MDKDLFDRLKLKMPEFEPVPKEHLVRLNVGFPTLDKLLEDGLRPGTFSSVFGGIPKYLSAENVIKAIPQECWIQLPPNGQYFSCIEDAEASFDAVTGKGRFKDVSQFFLEDGSLDLMGIYKASRKSDDQPALGISIKENPGSPIHTFIQRWNARGVYLSRRPGEPKLKGSMQCGLNYAWVKWARDYYGISLVAAIHIGRDFIEKGGIEPDDQRYQ